MGCYLSALRGALLAIIIVKRLAELLLLSLFVQVSFPDAGQAELKLIRVESCRWKRSLKLILQLERGIW